MAIVTEYWLQCDRCYTPFKKRLSWNDTTTLANRAKIEGWYEQDGHWFCPGCRDFNDIQEKPK